MFELAQELCTKIIVAGWAIIPGMSSGAVSSLASQSQAERESVKRIDLRSNASPRFGNAAKILEIILLLAAVGAILAVFSLPILFRFVEVSYF